MEDKISIGEILPKAPEVTKEQWEKARATGQYESIAFEEYKFIAQIVAITARIEISSPAFQKIEVQHSNILIGLMNRCARLMLATLDLSHKAKFGETSAIIFRCILESGVKIIWLCKDPVQEKFDRYVGDSLKPEIELEEMIRTNIENRDGEILPIETRMLKSVDFHITKAQTTRQKIVESKKMPDIATLIKDIGFDRLMYNAFYRMGSHHIHGTWPSLIFHYLEESNKEGVFIPRGNDASTRANEFIGTSLIMIKALLAYCEFALDKDSFDVFKALLDACEKENLNIFDDMTKHDF